MSNIFSGIQQFFINIISVITTAILVISPFDKPQPQPSPTPTVIQEAQEATTPAEVKGISSKDNKSTSIPTPKIPKPTSSPTLAPEIKKSYITPPQTYQTPPVQPNKETVIIIQQQPPVQLPLPNPVIVPDNSWQQKTCTDGIKEIIADLERRKQEAIDQTTASAQRECERRGYSAPDYGSCKALIDQRIADLLASLSYDYMIKDTKLEYGCP